MRRLILLALLPIASACTESTVVRTSPNAVTDPATASARPTIPEDQRPSALKPDDAEIPAAVRAIEIQIDRKQAVIADEILIEVSCNYEWDVALTGDRVGKQVADRGGHRCEAVGAPRAIFRNLDLRARNRITFWKSGLDVTPFIRIVARGDVRHIDADATGTYRVKNVGLLRIDNAALTVNGDATAVGATEK